MNCPNCGNELAKLKKSYFCEECEKSFSFDEIESTGFSEFEKLVISRYPQMIALPYYEMLRETNETAKVKLLVDVFTNILKYLALIVETDYLKSNVKNQEVNDWILKLERPLISSWNIFLGKAIPVLEAAGWSFTIPEIPEFHRNVETKVDKKDRILIRGGYYDANGDFIEGDKSLAMLEALVNYRNSFAHGFNPPADEAREGYMFYRPVLDKILSRMEWCVNYTMYRFIGDALIPLMGNEPGKPEDAGELKAGHDGDILIRDSEGKLQPIVPLFVTPSAHFLDLSDRVDLMGYEDKTDKIIRYISPDGVGRPTAGTINKWNRLFDEKRIILEERTEETLERTELFERAKTSAERTIKTLVETKKVMEDKILRRPAQEGKLIAYIGGSFPIFFVRATSGAGKTNLLSIMAQTWIEEGKAVLFRKADEIDTADFREFICKELGLSRDFNWINAAQRLGFETDPPVIIIDALNEKPDGKDMFNSILAFAKEAGRTCKIVVSWRAINESELPEVSDEDIELIYPGTENKDNEKGLIHRAALLERLNHLELAEMWDLYAADKKRFSPVFTLNELIEENRRFGEELKNPLILRLFMEVYHGRKVKGTISSINLWKDYVELLEKQNPGAKNFLMLLSKFSFNQCDTTPELHSVYIDPELGPYIRNTQVDSPYFRLKRAGVLAELRRDSGVRIGFTHEGLGQYMTAQVIADEPANQSAEAILDIAKQEMPGIERSLAYFCMRLLSEEKINIITDLIRTGDEEAIQIAAEALTQRFMEIDWKKTTEILDEIIALDADAGIEAVLKVNKFLEENLMEELRFRILEHIHTHGKERESKAWVYFYTQLSDNKSTPTEKRVQYMEHAYELWIKTGNEDEAWEASLSSSLAFVYCSLGEYDKALEFNNKSLNIRLNIYGEKHPDTARSYNNIGTVFSSLGEYDKALESLNKSLNIKLKIYDEEHPDTATSYNNIGTIYKSLGDYNKALESFNKSLNIRLTRYGEKHPATADSYNNIGTIYDSLGDFNNALDFYNKSLAIYIKNYGEEYPKSATSYDNIGSVNQSLGDYNRALESFNKSLNIRLTIYGEKHPDVATSYNNIGYVYNSLGVYNKALDLYNKSLAIYIKIFGKEHSNTAISYNNIASVYKHLGEYEKSLDFLNKSLEIRLKIFDAEHPDIAKSYNNIGFIYKSIREYDKALVFYHKNLNIKLKIYGDKHPLTAKSYFDIASLYIYQRCFDKALEYYQKSRIIELYSKDETHPQIIELNELIKNLEKITSRKQSIPFWKKFSKKDKGDNNDPETDSR
jgi:tetratricopeptide (TPR) repeat protein